MGPVQLSQGSYFGFAKGVQEFIPHQLLTYSIASPVQVSFVAYVEHWAHAVLCFAKELGGQSPCFWVGFILSLAQDLQPALWS